MPCISRTRTLGVDDEDFGRGDADGEVANLVGVPVAKPGIEGVVLRREEGTDVLSGPGRTLGKLWEHLRSFLGQDTGLARNSMHEQLEQAPQTMQKGVMRPIRDEGTQGNWA